jgi:hypothetical protein
MYVSTTRRQSRRTKRKPRRGATLNTREVNMDPWNEWRGVTEGEMLEELVGYDVHMFHVPAEEAREALEKYHTEELRKAWWYAIGRFNTDERDV